MSLIPAWALFPLLLAALAAGWGAVVERGTGSPLRGVLLIPVGLATMIVATALLTRWSVTAPATVPVLGVVAAIGLFDRRRLLRPALWPTLAAIGVLLVYGAPVLLFGSATFLGYIRLDDTGAFLNIMDHAMTHLHSFAAVGPSTSTYELVFSADTGPTYPQGSFLLPAIGHAFTGIDPAWIVQPYMAFCGVAVALSIWALTEPLIASPRIRALVAFVAAQPALLYGYAAWGGEKELAAAFLVALGAALLARLMTERPAEPRGLLPIAIASAALILTLGAGAAAWLVPGLIGLVVVWSRSAWPGRLKAVGRDVVLLAFAVAVFALPIWFNITQFFEQRSQGLFSSGTHPAQEKLGNLIQPLSGWQLAGIWPVGDFRVRAPHTVVTAILIGLAVLAAVVAIWMTLRRRQPGVIAYVAVALAGCAVFWAIEATPWATAKSLAISSPAVLFAALAGAGMVWGLRRSHRLLGVVGLLALLAVGGGVAWSNVLAYHDVLLAPRERLTELQHIGGLVAGKGPTFLNDYEIYGTRHFLRAGQPVAPADFRTASLLLRNGSSLIKSAYADLDSFPLETIEAYRSLVIPRSPVESRPPSTYHLAWRGRYYQLWQREEPPATKIIEHVPYGDSNQIPYCGEAQSGPSRPECSIAPVTIPSCPQVGGLAKFAQSQHAHLVAYQRPEPIVIRGDQMVWPAAWYHNPENASLTATKPGTAVAHIAVNSGQRYELWLGGTFSRGFEVSVDGQHLGRIKNRLANIGEYTPVGQVFLTAGVHTISFTYPHASLAPGSGENSFTTLAAIALEPLETPATELLTVAPAEAGKLCGRTLDWIEIVR